VIVTSCAGRSSQVASGFIRSHPKRSRRDRDEGVGR
jgi:hypothetical protein